jgi:hypothetical protein
MKKLRIYVDTSVIGGCFDAGFAADSQTLIQMALDGKAVLIVSELLVRELQNAPGPIRQFYASLPAWALEELPADPESIRLHDAYLAAGVVGPGADSDAQHVANATVAGADLIVRRSTSAKVTRPWRSIRRRR